ncbi:methylated-DNA--[protein]-cysteine S-methyltransferase [Nanoarchaeota archaeon NZ13-N]|nr:MAG: methylated-DNA--[protein]-cysteine S-methyltransferase [Nanoarchaeota archaeon NZ13-N]
MINLLRYNLLSAYLIKGDKILAYSLNFDRSSLIRQLEKIRDFHGLEAEIVFNERLDEYFEEKLKGFFKYKRNLLDIDLSLYRYSEVYRELLRIPFGEVITYSDFYRRVGKYSFFEVIRALTRNPFIIFIPCHRLVRKDGKIGGYTPLGKVFKERIIEFEREIKEK